MGMFRATVAVVLLLVAAGASAAEAQRLPAFQVAAPDGHKVESQAMTAEHKWLLIYLGPGCRPCESLLASLQTWQSPALMSRLVLVVGGHPAEGAAWVQKALPPELSGLRWYVDADREASTALELTGMPVLLGVLDGEVEWQVSGVLNNPSALESVVRSWVEQ